MPSSQKWAVWDISHFSTLSLNLLSQTSYWQKIFSGAERVKVISVPAPLEDISGW
jgi:hypothetical protein